MQALWIFDISRRVQPPEWVLQREAQVGMVGDLFPLFLSWRRQTETPFRQLGDKLNNLNNRIHTTCRKIIVHISPSLCYSRKGASRLQDGP
jgi:hypothetical protein